MRTKGAARLRRAAPGAPYGQVMLTMWNSFVIPEALTLTWSTKCAVIFDPSDPLTTMLPMSWTTELFRLRLSPNQNVNSPW